MIRAALSFTGGKDCLLAMHRAKEQYEVVVLVTFCPFRTTSMPFRSHSLQVMEQQAKAMRLVHHTCIVKEEQGNDYLASYRDHIRQLCEEYKVEALITGKDILPRSFDSAYVCNFLAVGDVRRVCGDFMERAVDGTNVRLVRPLWHQPRAEILEEMLDTLQAVVTCVNTRRLNIKDAEAEAIVGHPLTRDGLIKKADGELNGGEFGEYHTMVVDAPQLFVHGRVDISQGKCVNDNDIVYWHAFSPTFIPK